MASFLYQSGLFRVLTGDIDLNTDTFRLMLVTASYVEDKNAHDFRDDVTNEITGTGYTSGGEVCAVTVTRDDGNNEIDIVFGQVQWASINIDGAGARGAVIYKSRGGAASADDLLAYIDFGADVDAAGGIFTAQQSTLRLTNPSV